MSDGSDRWAALREERSVSSGGRRGSYGKGGHGRGGGGQRGGGYSQSARGGGGGSDRRSDGSRGYEEGPKSHYSAGRGNTRIFNSSGGGSPILGRRGSSYNGNHGDRWSQPRGELEDSARKGLAPAVMPRSAPGGVDAGTNPLNRKPYSRRYVELLESRKKLPIYSKREDVIKTVEDNRFVVLVGDTGSGKTTQVPQLLALNRKPADSRLIACTQPRRIAAITVAQRVADEMDVRLGDEVGYAVRYEDETSSRTVLKYCTDGLLLRESVSDPQFSKYSTIIIDEAHERTISTDILMGMLKEVTRKRDDFRLVIMSATLDAAKLQSFFDDAPLLSIPGRMFPVDIKFLPEVAEDYLEAAVSLVIDIHLHEDEGDILVFLTGEDEISAACKDISVSLENKPGKGYRKGVEILPLYSSLPPNAIQRVFQPVAPGRRKIVVSTNVAETSITIDGIVYVVDPGFAKQKVYNPRNRVESLQVAPVSAASAVQRTGRAGRTRAGVCYRLYTEESFEQLAAMSHPEILRSNLNSVVLQLRTLGVNPVQFDFIDPPPPETVMRALESLFFLGALDGTGQVTKLGSAMSRFPLDPELARMLLAAPALGVAQEVLAIVAMVSAAANCFVRPAIKAREADKAKRRFEAEESDHLTFLNVYTEFLERRPNATDWCWENFINERAMESAVKANDQLERILIDQGFSSKSQRTGFDYDEQSAAIRQALAKGFFMYSAVECKRASYVTTKDNVEVKLHPSSGLRTRPVWVIYNELVLTTKAFIRNVTEVDGNWLLRASPDYFNPASFTDSIVKAEIAKITGYRRAGRSAMNTGTRQAY